MDHSGDRSRRSKPRSQLQLRQPLQMLRYTYSERPRQRMASLHRQVGSREGPESLDCPILSGGTNQARRGSRKRPDPPTEDSGPGTCHNAALAGRVVTYRSTPQLAAWFGIRRYTARLKESPGVEAGAPLWLLSVASLCGGRFTPRRRLLNRDNSEQAKTVPGLIGRLLLRHGKSASD